MGRSAGGKGTRLFREEEEEDHLAADLVLVVPEAGVDRVEWAKQLVAQCRALAAHPASLSLRPRTILSVGGGPRDLARVGARLRHLARGNEVLALDHQSTPGGDPQTGDRSRSAVATWTARRRRRLSRSPA